MQKKITFSLDETLLEEIAEYADKMHLSRSAAVAVLCSTTLQSYKSIDVISDLMEAYKQEQQKI